MATEIAGKQLSCGRRLRRSGIGHRFHPGTCLPFLGTGLDRAPR